LIAPGIHRVHAAFLLPAFCACLLAAERVQAADVQAQVEIAHPGARITASMTAAQSVVLWLSPESAGGEPAIAPGHFRMTQKGKSFHPHLLVVPLGSTVAFPNLDPFFHNVFSQFNGKRFDLGLYEAGSTRDVRFDHEGVSYIFCNIHPEMSAVIVTLSTPWYAVASGSGGVTLHGVPAGTYELHVWAEGADAQQLEALGRRVHVGDEQADLGVIRVVANEAAPAHKNKFGDDYRPDASTATPY
jgi:plastocyanin